MRILHVIDQISQKIGGGASKVVYDLAHAQAKLGHDVTIYSCDYKAKGQLPPLGVNLVMFKCWFNLFKSIRVVPGLLSASYDFDIMHLHNYRTLVNIFAVIGDMLPFVLQAHGSCQPISGKTAPLHNNIWNDTLFNKASRYIADADMEIAQYITEGADKSKIALIPVGLNMDEYKDIPSRYSGKSKIVLFLGRFDKNKGVDLLVKAIKLLDRPDIWLEIAGVDYGYLDDIRRLLKKLKMRDRVVFLGPLYGKDKVEAYTRADVFVMPSRYEMWGLTFMEALACGTPVIMTDTCQASKLLPDECGIVVPFDAAALADGIENALDSNMVNMYRDYRRQWVEQYSWDKLAPRVINLYEDILNG